MGLTAKLDSFYKAMNRNTIIILRIYMPEGQGEKTLSLMSRLTPFQIYRLSFLKMAIHYNNIYAL